MTGTDTGVGKTAVACGILGALRRRGLNVGAFKPAESGHALRNGAWPPDAANLSRAAGLNLPRDDVVPYVFREPIAPLVASRLERDPIRLARLDAAWRRMHAGRDLALVEGAGGIAVPLTDKMNMLDLASRWRLPLLIVARPGLGTINHTVLTVEHALSRKRPVLGVVINNYPQRPNTAEKTNPHVIERLTRVPVLGIVPAVEGVDVDAGRVEAMTGAVEDHVDLEPILALASGGHP